MYTLACQDAGMDCDYVAKGQTMDETIKTGMEHVKKAHPEKMRIMEKMPREEMMNMIKEE